MDDHAKDIAIVTTDTEYTGAREVKKVWSLEEIDEIFTPGEGTIVAGLGEAVRMLCRENAEQARRIEAGDLQITILQGCVAQLEAQALERIKWSNKMRDDIHKERERFDSLEARNAELETELQRAQSMEPYDYGFANGQRASQNVPKTLPEKGGNNE